MNTTTHSTPMRFANWRVDGDGILRVTAHILKEGVYPYSAKESGAEDILPGIDPIMQYIPRKEFTEQALASLEGKPVTIPFIEKGQEWHQWRDAKNTLVDGLSIGSIAGKPTVSKDGCIACDMLIFDQDTITAIIEKKLVEVSAGYTGSMLVEAGCFEDIPYHAKQKDLQFNHVLLLPEGMGRCGYDVRIVNKKPKTPKGASTMPNPRSIKVLIGNKARTFRFSNEEDAEMAELMLEEEKAQNAEEVIAINTAKADLEARILQLQEELLVYTSQLEAANKQVEELGSPSAQEALAQEMVEQMTAEEVIIAAETDKIPGISGTEKEAFANTLCQCKSLAQRRAVTVARVMNMRGMSTSNWTQDAFDGAFKVLAASARNAATEQRVLNGRQSTPNERTMSGNRERMLRPMKARNTKPEVR